MLKEQALHHYLTLEKCCADGILHGGNDEYQLNIAQEDLCLFHGFCGGMASGEVCGCLAGAIGVLSKKYAGRDKEEFHNIIHNFVELFKEKLQADSINCSVLEAKYKTEELRCSVTVGLAADALEEYIQSLES